MIGQKEDLHHTVDCSNPDWLDKVCEYVNRLGFATVTGVLPPPVVEEARAALYVVRDKIVAEIGQERVALGDWSCLPILFKHHKNFLKMLEIPQVLETVDALLSNSAIMRFQVGTIVPPLLKGSQVRLKHNEYHMNFKWPTGIYRMALDLAFPLDDATRPITVVPGSHRWESVPSREDYESMGVHCHQVAGSMVIVDSGLWHKEDGNFSEGDSCSIGIQFARPFCKPYFDYVRLLGEDAFEALPERSRHFLGLYTRVPSSLDEYYRPPAERQFKPGVL